MFESVDAKGLNSLGSRYWIRKTFKKDISFWLLVGLDLWLICVVIEFNISNWFKLPMPIIDLIEPLKKNHNIKILLLRLF